MGDTRVGDVPYNERTMRESLLRHGVFLNAAFISYRGDFLSVVAVV